MPVIDADTHVDETDATWEHFEPAFARYKPGTAYPPNPDPSRLPARYWMIDGKRQIRFVRDDVRTGTTAQTRELLDVGARLRHMDQLGVDVHVMYPTLLAVEFSDNPELELGLRRSYNRWLAERCAESHGRLRWICAPPMMSLDKALEELRFAKDHGACGVLKKGDREAGKWPNDEYFFPLYDEAQRLDLPICFHQGSGVPDFTPTREFSHSQFIRIVLPVVHAFHSLIFHDVPAKFPRLRWGFIEAGASWVPFAVYDLRRRLERTPPGSSMLSGPQYSLPDNLLAVNRMYVSLQVDEDLAYLTRFTGEDQLLIGSDYTHGDAAKELEFPRLLARRAERGDITPTALRKILDDNPRRFYGL